MSDQAQPPMEFLPRHESWPPPPLVALTKAQDGQLLQLTMTMSISHVLSLCSLVAAGAKSHPDDLIGPQPPPFDRKMLCLTTADLVEHVRHLVLDAARLAREQKELDNARRMRPVEKSEP